MSIKYIPTIGLEIHAELATKSKMFCSCANNPDEEKANVNICPVCMGQPGTLPVLNKEAIKHVLKVGLAVGGTIADFTEWDRKNYFYPDIPKGYQISQYKYPLVEGGSVLAGGNIITITRIHLEEDTAQSTHDTHEKSLVNYNRAGVPLMELVTEPVIHDAATAVAFAKELQLLLRYLGVGEANLEKGEMRVEANISVATEEDTVAGKFGTKTEVKNLNSFRAVERAIAYEIARQKKIAEKIALGQTDEKVVQETRGWDEGAGKTFSQRAKESSHDYRYFPEPDIPKMKLREIPEFDIETLRANLPELPWTLRNRFVKEFMMTEKEAAMFTDTPELSKYFESILAGISGGKPELKTVRLVINYLSSDYVGLLKKQFGEEHFITHISDVGPANFAALINLVVNGKVNSRGAKDTLGLMMKDPAGDPEAIATQNGFIQKNDEGALKVMILEIITANPTVVEDYKKGKVAALQFLIGQGMKMTKGSSNPEMLKKLFLESIK